MDMKTQFLDMSKQQVSTRDNISLIIDPAVSYRIINPNYAKFKVQNLEATIRTSTTNSLLRVIGKISFQELLEKRGSLADEIENELRPVMIGFGLKLEDIYIKDFILAGQLQSALCSSTREKKIAEAKVISAQSDVEVAKMIKESAELLNSSSSMQIRYFEVIQKISEGQNPKVIFLPLDLNFQ